MYFLKSRDELALSLYDWLVNHRANSNEYAPGFNAIFLTQATDKTVGNLLFTKPISPGYDLVA